MLILNRLPSLPQLKVELQIKIFFLEIIYFYIYYINIHIILSQKNYCKKENDLNCKVIEHFKFLF